MRGDRYLRRHEIIVEMEEWIDKRERLCDELEQLEQLGPYSIKAIADSEGILGVGHLKRKYGKLRREEIIGEIEQIDKIIEQLNLLLDELEYDVENYGLDDFDIECRFLNGLRHLPQERKKYRGQRRDPMWDFKENFRCMGF